MTNFNLNNFEDNPADKSGVVRLPETLAPYLDNPEYKLLGARVMEAMEPELLDSFKKTIALKPADSIDFRGQNFAFRN